MGIRGGYAVQKKAGKHALVWETGVRWELWTSSKRDRVHGPMGWDPMGERQSGREREVRAAAAQRQLDSSEEKELGPGG